MFRGITSIMYKEVIHMLRDPRTFLLMLVVPSVQLTIFGLAIDLDVKDVATVVYNLDGREPSRDVLNTFWNSGYFEPAGTALSDEQLISAIVRGEAKVGLKIPPDYSDNVLRGRPANIQVLIDGSDSTVAMQALNVANAIALRESMEIIAHAVDGGVGGGNGPPIDTRPRMLFNPDMRTANFMVPGLVGVVLQVTTMLLTTFAIVREKENGTLEQLMVTPVSRLGLMVGKLLPYGVIGAFETAFLLTIMRFLFQVPIAGSILLLAGFAVVFLFCALGLGLLISTFAENQIQALQYSIFIVMPSILLSGFVFPVENMPYAIYLIGRLVPVTYFVEILRGIILRDAGFMDLWTQGAILAFIGLIVLTVSTIRFRKTL